MKHLRLLAAIIAATFLLTSCSGNGIEKATSSTPLPSITSTPVALSKAWTGEVGLKASVVSNDLTHAGICQSDSTQWTDVKEWQDDIIRSCYNYHDFNLDASKMACPLEIYIAVGKELGQSPGLLLDAEDGYAVAGLYAPGWEIDLSPSGDIIGSKDASVAVEICKPTIDELAAKIGGTLELNK